MPFNKYFSLVIIPRKTSKVKKIKIPVFLVWVTAFLVIGVFISLGTIIYDYYGIRKKLTGMEENEQLLIQQQEKIKEYTHQHRQLQLHFDHLQTLNERLNAMVITTIDTEKKSNLRDQDTAENRKKIAEAAKTSVLNIIASEASELDSDLKHEYELYFKNLITFFNAQKNPFNRFPTGFPTKGYLINEFGMHVDPYTGQVRPQHGIDLAANLDAPIKAPADGIVIEIKKDENFGNVLVLDHGNGFETRYGHVAGFEVDKGDIVTKGMTIAQVGNSGKTTGPRLYYEVLYNGIPQNPVKYSID